MNDVTNCSMFRAIVNLKPLPLAESSIAKLATTFFISIWDRTAAFDDAMTRMSTSYPVCRVFSSIASMTDWSSEESGLDSDLSPLFSGAFQNASISSFGEMRLFAREPPEFLDFSWRILLVSAITWFVQLPDAGRNNICTPIPSSRPATDKALKNIIVKFYAEVISDFAPDQSLASAWLS